MTAATLPAANVASARPATRGPRCSTSVTNNGTKAMRKPNTDQPVAKLENSADQYALLRNAIRSVTGSSVSFVGAATDECLRLTNTTPAATRSATPEIANGAARPSP